MGQRNSSKYINLHPSLAFYKDRGSANVDENFQEIVADEAEVLKSVEYLMSSNDLDSFGESDHSAKWSFQSKRSG